LTLHSPRKDRSNSVRYVHCDGAHPAKHKGCTVHKGHLSPPQTVYSSRLHTLQTQPGVSYAEIT
jgi:hypothetical protein